MVNVKRYIKFILLLLVLFLIIFICVRCLSKGYTKSYTIKDKFDVEEIYTKEELNEHDNYYVKITANNIDYKYQFYKIFKDDSKVVKDVLYYDGEYKCLLPIFADNLKVDFLCYKDKVFYNYYDIVGNDEDLDNFIDSIDKKVYSLDYFKDNLDNKKTVDKVTYYSNNIPDNYVVSLTTLKGIITINNGKVNTIELFDYDVYKREISTYVNNYYLTANYTDRQTFRDFYIVNIIDGKKRILKAPDYISFNSYIQGVVDDDVYVYDKNNQKQYKINTIDATITEIGNRNKGIRYYNGKWDYITILRADNELYFTNTNEEFDKYEYFYKAGNKLSGFYYFFKETKDGYEVYRANVQDNKNIKYLFSVSRFNDVIYEEDYIFYKDGNSIKMYSDYTGIKTLITTSELEFNNNIIFNVYNNG